MSQKIPAKSVVNRPRRNNINAKQMRSTALELAQRPPQKKQKEQSGLCCGICGIISSSSENKADITMVQCEVKTCGSWYHMSCLLLSINRKHVLFTPSRGMRDAIFICEKCFDQPESDYAKGVSQAIVEFTTTIERLQKSAKSGYAISRDISITTQSTVQERDTQHTFPNGVESLVFKETGASDFEPAREEMFQGYDESEIRSLIHDLDQYTENYDLEVCKALEWSGSQDANTMMPLKEWKVIDTGENNVLGQSWYSVDFSSETRSKSHGSITAALRSMLSIPDEMPLQIAPNLETLSFSQVHKAFISWFVFDILGGKLCISQLPNMAAMTIIKSAVWDFGESSKQKSSRIFLFPLTNDRQGGENKGEHILREVLLRVWKKEGFEEIVLQNKPDLMRRFESFLEPLTNHFGRSSAWSSQRDSIIESTIKLWFYLNLVGGKVELIEPKIGDAFNPLVYEGYNKEGEIQHLKSNSRLKVLWVLRRGFIYAEVGIDGKEATRTFKAKVFV